MISIFPRAEMQVGTAMGRRHSLQFVNRTVAYVIAMVSAALYLTSGSAGYAWPAIDMAPYFIAQSGDGLATDFFAKCSSLPNPRHVFGQLVLSLHWFGLDWQESLLLIEAFLAVLLPTSMYCSLASAHLNLVSRPSAVSILSLGVLSLVLVLSDEVQRLSSVAWWRPIQLQATSHNVSLLLGAVAIALAWVRGPRFLFSILAIAASTFVHPAIGASCLVVVGVLLLVGKGEARKVAALTLAAMASVLAVRTLYAPTVSLPASEFVRIYVAEAHPAHYLPSSFESLHAGPWWISFAGVIALLITMSGWLFRQHEVRAATVLGLLAGCYGGSILLQFLAVEILEIKLLAALGPSRFTLWGAWFCIAGLSCVVAATLKDPLSDLPVFARIGSTRVTTIALVGSTLVAACVGVLRAGEFHREPLVRNGPVLQWVELNTSPNSVFLLPHAGGLRTDIPIVTLRPSYHGTGFPFSEDCFTEYSRRSSLVDGNHEQRSAAQGTWLGARIQAIYDSRDISYLAQLVARESIDYAILTPGHFQRLVLEHGDIETSYRDQQYVVLSAVQVIAAAAGT